MTSQRAIGVVREQAAITGRGQNKTFPKALCVVLRRGLGAALLAAALVTAGQTAMAQTLKTLFSFPSDGKPTAGLTS